MKKAKAGFTLVELIVVIAILGILAGIAIPVYSGYIKKANQAADNQLLAAVNTAFAAACLENDNNAKALTDIPRIPLTGEEGKKKVDLASVTPYPDDFKRYFAGNENSEFKTAESLVWDAENGVFTLSLEAAPTAGILNSGYTFHDYQEAADAYNISNFKNMGVEGVTSTVDSLRCGDQLQHRGRQRQGREPDQRRHGGHGGRP